MLFVIYYVEGHIEVCPTVLGFAWELTSLGHQVEIRTLGTEDVRTGTLPPGCRALNFFPTKRQRLLRRIVTLLPGFESLWFAFQNLKAERRLASEERAVRRANIGVE